MLCNYLLIKIDNFFQPNAMKYILFSIFISISFTYNQLYAQVPGYQGKRSFIEAKGVFTIGIGGALSAQNRGFNSFPDGVNNAFALLDQYGLALNYITGRRSILKVSFDYSVSGAYLTAYTEPISNRTSDRDRRDLFYQVHATDFNLSVDLYTNKASSLAPIGFYWNLGLRVIPTTGVLRDQKVTYATGAYPDNIARGSELNSLEIDPSIILVGPTIKWGFRTVFANRITLNCNLQSTIFMQSLPIGILTYTETNQSKYHFAVLNSIQGRYLIGAEIGVGVLLF